MSTTTMAVLFLLLEELDYVEDRFMRDINIHVKLFDLFFFPFLCDVSLMSVGLCVLEKKER